MLGDTVRRSNRHSAPLFIYRHIRIKLPTDWQMTLGVRFRVTGHRRRLRKRAEEASALLSVCLGITFTQNEQHLFTHSSAVCNTKKVWSIHHRQWHRGGCLLSYVYLVEWGRCRVGESSDWGEIVGEWLMSPTLSWGQSLDEVLLKPWRGVNERNDNKCIRKQQKSLIKFIWITCIFTRIY